MRLALAPALALALIASAGPTTTHADPEADPAREAAALAFVREHHPELASLLDQLKPMRPAEYEKAIADLSQVGKTLDNLKRRDARRYEMGLEVWKARSRVELLTAQLASGPSPELEGQLRAALATQIDAEIRQQRLEREQAEARLRKIEETLNRLETNRDGLVESRYQVLLKKGQRARRQAAGKSSPAPAPAPAAPDRAKKKGERKG